MLCINKTQHNYHDNTLTLKDYLNNQKINCESISVFSNFIDKFESSLINHISSLNKFEFILFYRFEDEIRKYNNKIIDIENINNYDQLEDFNLTQSFSILYKFNNSYYVLYLTRYTVYKTDYNISMDYRNVIGCFCKTFNEYKFNSLHEAINSYNINDFSSTIVNIIEYYNYKLKNNKTELDLITNKKYITIDYLLSFLCEDDKAYLTNYFLDDLNTYINTYNNDIETY